MHLLTFSNKGRRRSSSQSPANPYHSEDSVNSGTNAAALLRPEAGKADPVATKISSSLLTTKSSIMPRIISSQWDDKEYIECMVLHLEKDVLNQNQIDTWDRDIVAIPYSMKITGNRYWILGLRLNDQRSMDLHYKCNDLDGAKVQKMVDKKFHSILFLVLECPSSVDPRNTTLKTLSSFNVTTNKMVQTIYNMTWLDECERRDMIETFKERMHVPHDNHQHHDPAGATGLSLPTSSTMDSTKVLKIGVTACFIADRAKAMQWEAYHYTIGVDHILWLLYVNEDWDDARDLPQRDYITWVPWNFHVSPNASIQKQEETNHWRNISIPCKNLPS